MEKDRPTVSGSDKHNQYFSFLKSLHDYQYEGFEEERESEAKDEQEMFSFEKYRVAKPRRNLIKMRILHDKGD